MIGAGGRPLGPVGPAVSSGSTDMQREHRALIVSMVGAGGFALLGIGLGLVTGSQVILFDGFFSLIGLALAALALAASKLTRAAPTPNYPFGREGYAPLVIGIEGIALLATCAYATLEAVNTILSGGGEIVGGWGIVYAAISFVVPLSLAWWLRRTSNAELVHAEATQWRAAGIFGLGMLIAFAGAALLDQAGHTRAAGYVDPSLVIVASAMFVVPPLRMLRTMARELLEAAPEAELYDAVHTAVTRVSRAHELEEHHLRATKVGPKLYVEVDYVVDADWRVARSDEVRRALLSALRDLQVEPWLTVEFTADPTWGL